MYVKYDINVYRAYCSRYVVFGVSGITSPLWAFVRNPKSGRALRMVWSLEGREG